jgi:hypothetical protein
MPDSKDLPKQNGKATKANPAANVDDANRASRQTRLASDS